MIKNMMRKIILCFVVLTAICSCKLINKENTTESEIKTEKKYQATAPPSQAIGKEAFDGSKETIVRWLGMSGFMVNSQGTTLMIDPILEDFDMPLLIDIPIKVKEVPRLDAILITHSDNDHFSRSTCVHLKPVTQEYHSTLYVDSLMKNMDLPSFGHKIGNSFLIENIKVTLTPADHLWQIESPELRSERTWKQEDCAGFWIETPDGTIWAPGDSRLMAEHLQMPTPDAILFDFSDNEWHFTLEGAIKLANAYPNTPLLLHHWGSVDAPDFSPFNGDPEILKAKVDNPERVVVLAPGEPYKLSKLKD